MNSFGNIYRLTSFGESHGRAMGGIIDGLPAGMVFDLKALQAQLDRRRPGSSALTTARNEADRLVLLSGIMGYDPSAAAPEPFPLADDTPYGISLGTPVGFMIENRDARSCDYDVLRHVCRPSHADYAWHARYGIRDWRGGGRSSGRETISRVVAGAFAMQALSTVGVAISSEIHSIGTLRHPDAEEVAEAVCAARRDSDSIGGVVECRITGVPAGVGEPVFGKLEQMLASAMLSIGGVKGFEYGSGFAGCRMWGSEAVDEFVVADGGVVATATNNSGGIQGGISNGMAIEFRVAVKPTPTIARPLKAVDENGQPLTFTAKGRHDPCIMVRVLPVVEAMAAIVLFDAMLMKGAAAFGGFGKSITMV